MMAQEAIESSPFRREIRWLFQAAMVIFLVTVIIGILNGLDLVEFDRPILLTHVHAGTMGWMTLGVFGVTLWLFSGEKPASQRQTGNVRVLTILAILAIALYVLTFFVGNPTVRPITGSLTLVVIVGFLWWAIVRSRQIKLTVPHLAILAALTTLTIGAVVGVLLQLYLGGGVQWLPQGAFGSHPASLVTGYLILAGMAMAEWGLRSPGVPARIPKLGIVQVVLPFLGGLSLLVGSLLDIFVLIVLIAPLQIVAVLIFLTRVGRRILQAGWLQGSNLRLFGLSAIFLVLNVGLIAYLVATYADRIEEIPPWLIFALDHAIYIGLMTNGIFGFIYEASYSRRAFWPWADHVLFWGMNIGIVGFVVGLISQETILKQLSTPIMGTSILLAMLTYAIRLQTEKREALR